MPSKYPAVGLPAFTLGELRTIAAPFFRHGDGGTPLANYFAFCIRSSFVSTHERHSLTVWPRQNCSGHLGSRLFASLSSTCHAYAPSTSRHGLLHRSTMRFVFRVYDQHAHGSSISHHSCHGGCQRSIRFILEQYDICTGGRCSTG